METTFAYIADPVNLEQLYSGFKLSFWSAASLSRVHLKMPPRFLGELSWESSPGRCRGRGLVVTGNLTRRHLEGLPRRFVLKKLQQAVKLRRRGAPGGPGPLPQEEAGLILSRFPGLALTTGRSMAMARPGRLKEDFPAPGLEPRRHKWPLSEPPAPGRPLPTSWPARDKLSQPSDPDQHRLIAWPALSCGIPVAGKVSTQVARVLSADIVVFGGDPCRTIGEEFKAGAALCDLSDSHLFNVGTPARRTFYFDECALEVPRRSCRWRCPLFRTAGSPPGGDHDFGPEGA